MTKPMARKISTPSLLLDQVFFDVESLAQALNWVQEFRQLEPGRLEAGVQIVGHELCQVIKVRFNRSFHQQGHPPPGFAVFGLPDLDTSNLQWAGNDLRVGSVVNFNLPAGLDMTSQGEFRGTIFAFEKHHFTQLVDLLGLEPSILAELDQEPYWIPESNVQQGLSKLLADIFEAAKDEDRESLREYQDSFDVEIAASILQTISGANLPEPPPLSSRQKTLKRALKQLESDSSSSMTVTSLCQAVGTSYSTLERAFVEEFDIPPKTYIRIRRLTAVQKALARPDYKGTISDVAHEWGFWHMSAFSKDYRKQFGELPSETRSRANHQ